jgi:hypothetical protein
LGGCEPLAGAPPNGLELAAGVEGAPPNGLADAAGFFAVTFFFCANPMLTLIVQTIRARDKILIDVLCINKLISQIKRH